MKMRIAPKAGFTLVEIVVVISIMAILSTIITVNVSHVLLRHQQTRIETDLTMLEIAAYHYYYDQSTDNSLAISQEILVAAGHLPRIISSPIEGYHYQISVKNAKPTIQIALTDEQGTIYQRGTFIGCIPR